MKSGATKRILIGEITTAHGIKGLVKMRSYVDDENFFGKPLFTGEAGDKTIRLTLKNPLKGDWLAEVESITDRNAAERLCGTKLYIDRGALPETAEDEYYIEDLKGLMIVDPSGTAIGTLTDIVNYGAGDLVDVKGTDGKEFYLPYTADTILSVDLETKTMTVTLPETI